MCAKWLQSCPTLCNPMDYIACQAPLSMGILQERILEWVAMPSSRGSSWPRDSTHVPYASCTGRRGLYHEHHLGSPTNVNNTLQTIVTRLHIRSSDLIHHLTALSLCTLTKFILKSLISQHLFLHDLWHVLVFMILESGKKMSPSCYKQFSIRSLRDHLYLAAP